jgi:hypothetical protein
MQTEYVQLEVLLMMGTSLVSGNLCRKDHSPEKDNFTDKEKLAEACWNGLLQTILPELCLQPENNGVLYVWQVKEADSFLELELGEIPPTIEKAFSITPHLFFSSLSEN